MYKLTNNINSCQQRIGIFCKLRFPFAVDAVFSFHLVGIILFSLKEGTRDSAMKVNEVAWCCLSYLISGASIIQSRLCNLVIFFSLGLLNHVGYLLKQLFGIVNNAILNGILDSADSFHFIIFIYMDRPGAI